MTRVVVTGAAGFIGSNLVSALVGLGESVVGVDNFDPFYDRRIKEQNLALVSDSANFAFHELDIRQTNHLAALLTPDDVVIHLAAKAGVRPSILSPMAYIDTNVGGTASVVTAMKQAGCHRLVFGSSSSVYGDLTPVPFNEAAAAIHPVSPYAASKRGAELLLEAAAPLYGLRVASLRFFTVYGPRQRPDLAIHSFVRAIARSEPITLFGDGTQGRDYTYCDDIVAGIRSAMEWTSSADVGVEHFNLGGDRVIALAELIAILAAELGVEPIVRWGPMQAGDVDVTSGNLGKAKEKLGYAPQVAFEEGIQRFVAWFKAQPAHTVG